MDLTVKIKTGYTFVSYRTAILLIGAFLLISCNPAQTPTLEAEEAENEAVAIGNSVPTATPITALPTILRASETRLNDPRPNIIVIMTDDQPVDTVEYMPTVREVLMKNGIYFKNVFTTTPICCPSRASILTGLYAHNHEVYNNRPPNGSVTKFKDDSTIAVWLKEAGSGYSTGYYGKYLNGYGDIITSEYIPPGWDQWWVLSGHSGPPFKFYYNYTMSNNGQAVFFPASKANFSADVITYNAVNFINQARNQPFLLFVGYYNPHDPHIPAPRHKDTFRKDSGIAVPRTPNFLEADISDKPVFLSEVETFTPEGYDQIYLKVLRSLLSVDDGVAEILNALKLAGVADKTVIVYTSDNGLSVGQHRWLGKNCPYEDCIRVPFIVYAPGMFEPRTETRMVANIDLAPTFAELAGVHAPDNINGSSLLPLLSDPSTPWRDSLLLEHWPAEGGEEGSDNIPQYSGIRTENWKYVEYASGEMELYDLKNDPYELVNVANLPQFKDIQAQLKLKLGDLKQK